MKYNVGLALSLITASVLMGETFELGKIEVSESKDISANQTTEFVDAQTIKDTESKTVAQALESIPGTYIQQTGARNDTGIRIRGFNQSRVPIYVDGIPVYVPYDKTTDLSRFTTYDIDEIDVSKGYVSPMYGANTMGGAVNLITKKPTKEFEGEVGAGVFSGNGQEEYLTMGTNQGKYYGLISVSNYERDYFKLSNDYTANGYENGGKRENSDSQDRKINIKVGYTPNDTDEYAFNYIAQRGEKGQPYFASDITAPVAMATNRHWYWPDWDKTSYYFLTKTALNDAIMLKTRWYRDEFYNKINWYNNLPSTSSKITEVTEYNDYTLGGNAELDFKLTEAQMLKLSVTQKKDYHKDIDSASPGQDIKAEGTTTSYGLEYSLKVTDQITWVTGASYDENKIDKAEYRSGTTIKEFPKYDTDAFNPETALYYKLSDATTLYGSIAKKSNMPTLKDRYSTKLGTYVPNPDLKAERSINYEVGIDQKVTDTHVAHVALFLSESDDYIASVNVPDVVGVCTGGKCKQSQNIGKEEHKGVEVSLDSFWDEYISSSVSYTYIDADIKDNPANPYVTDIPKHSFAGRLKYSPIAMVDIIPQVRYESERYVSNDYRYGDYQTKDFFLMDLKVAYRPVKALELAVGVKNIFDKDYFYSYGYPQEGRSYYANARYSF
ncbi:TonB-dependent receptor [Sulfurospirillum diekertiae]|uniref:TonB-dependent receptor n=1 Tax=Sulfurospirillum diekertiae TaxID=1854492 RepID=A0A290HGY0_9BACT|nr:TonB-dependent receptor [Sulfurospirillum diekertiae]ATB70655.1 TonB-dependent receptor [Sulfurospirillum diekertiae]